MRLAILFLTGMFAGTAEAQDLSGYFAQVRAGNTPPLPAQMRKPDRAQSLLKSLAVFHHDSLPHVRRQAAGLVFTVGIQSGMPRVRTDAITLLITTAKDPDSGNVGVALDYLSRFNKTDFTPLHRDTLYAISRRKSPFAGKLIRLMAFIGITRAKEDWYALAFDRAANRADRWAALLALSRLGEDQPMSEVLTRIQRLPVDDDVVYEIFPDLVYTRRREAIGYLVQTMYSDKPACESADPERPEAIPCAYRVMELLAPVIERYPLQISSSGDVVTPSYPSALKQVRDWFTSNPNYGILSDRY